MTLTLWITALVLFGGTITASTINRIVGGNPTTVEKYPSIVQVEALSRRGEWSYKCGGSILTARYVLSAAQFFENGFSDAPLRRIRAGTTYRNHDGKIIYVARVINHPSYEQRLEGDISVIQLMLPLPSTPNIQQAKIPVSGTVIPDNLPVVLAGWGKNSDRGFPPKKLHEVTLYTINNRLCARRYKELTSQSIITENIICAGILDVGGRDASSDDAGGPIYYNGILIGIISRGYYSRNASFPAIVTSVGSYTDWIASNVV